MTNTRHYTFKRKALSILLTLVMAFSYAGLISGVFGMDLFGTKQTAEAATAGSYYVKITGAIEGWKFTFVSASNLNNTFTAGWDSSTNDSAGMVIRYKDDNGTASSTSDKTVDLHGWGNPMPTNKQDRSANTTVSGFPTGFYFCLDQNDAAGSTKLYVTKIEIGPSSSNLTTIWSGEIKLDSTSGTKKAFIYYDGTSSTSSNASVSSNSGWNMPYVNEGTLSGGNSAAIELTENGTASGSYSFSGAKDQYGVVWGPDPTWSVSGGNSTNSGSTVTFKNGSGVDYTATVKASFATGNNSHNPVEYTKNVAVSARHTLTVSANNGNWGGSTADKTYYGHTGDTKEIPEPTRTGYTFDGWTVSGGSVSGNTYTFANRNTSTLTAKWTLNDYTATFQWDNVPNSNGAVDPTAKTRVDTYHITDSNSFTFPNDSDLNKNFYTFDGNWKVVDVNGESSWSVGNTLYGAGDPLGANQYGNVTFRAQYTPIDYLITFDPNGGAAVRSNYDEATDTNHYKYNYECRASTLYAVKTTLPATTWLGYTLVGWKPTADVGSWDSTVTYPAGTALAGMHGNVTLKAKWSSVTSTVTLDMSEGGSISETSLAYAFSSSLALPNPTRTGYTFKGWKVTVVPNYGSDYNTYPAANRWVKDTEYLLGQETHVTLDSGKLGNVTLKPIWEHIKYTITYAGNGGTTPAAKDYYIDSAAFTLASTTRDGYDFDGWTVDAHDDVYNWTASSYDAGASVSGKYGNVTLKATWVTCDYTITLDVNGGDALANTTLPYKITESTALPASLTRTGYTFTGWKVVAPIAGSWVAGTVYSVPSPAVPMGNYGDLTLEAQWTPTEYTISKITNGGSNSNSVTYHINDAAFTLGASELAGYTFVNWTVNASVGSWVKDTAYGANTSISGMYGNVSLTANFTPTAYTITYKDEAGNVKWTDNYDIAHTFTIRSYSKSGYDFNGWVVSDFDETTGGGWYNDDVIPAGELSANMYYGDITLTPSLTPKNYTVSLISNGGLFASLPYTIESTDTLPAPTRNGYDFDGWKVTTAAGNWAENATFAAGDAVTGQWGSPTLTAQWTPKKYNITYIVGDTTTYPDGIIKQGTYGQTAPDLTAEEKAKPADAQYTYTFDHWDPALTTVTGEKTYTAVYTNTLNKYDITWMIPDDVNGTLTNYAAAVTPDVEYGTVPVYNNGVNPELASDSPAEYEWRFAGWSLTAGGEKLESIPTVSGTATYYALFTKVLAPEQVIWDIEGVTNTELWGIGEIPEWRHDTPTKADANGYKYTFTHWDPAPVTVVQHGGPYTYHARFSESLQDYTVTLKLNGGSMSDPLSMGYQMGDGVVFPTPAKTGYRFTGWLLDAAVGTWAAGTVVPAGTYDTASLWGNVSFTAQWAPEEYTITFAAASEDDVLPEDMTYTIESTNALPAAEATRVGHTLGGWLISVGGGNWTQGATLDAAYELLEKYGDVTLTPIWQVNTYMLTWISGDYTETSEAEYGSAILAYSPLSRMGYTAEWDNEVPATMPAEDLTFTAVYTAVEYYIRFNVNGGSAVDNFYYTIESNSTLPIPTRDGATFTGWKVAAAQGNWVKNAIMAGGASLNGKYGNVSLTAQWELETHFVTWVAGDVTRVTEWLYGAVPSYDGTPYKSPDESHSYVFREWDKEIVPVTADVTYTALFDATERKYTVVWNIDGATTTQYYSYGDTPVYPGANDPVRPSTHEYDFTFRGWNPAVAEVTGDVTYTAEFDTFTKLQGLSIDISSLMLDIGEDGMVTAQLYPTTATVRDVVWTSKNTDVATISPSGEVTAISPGVALINVSSIDAKFNAYCVVTVKPKHTSYVAISAGGVSTTQLPGAMLQLTATLQPENATDTGITWSSANESVATVDDNGLVRFVGVGETDITARASDGFSLGSIHVVTTSDESEVEDSVTTYRVTFGDFATGFRFKDDGEVYKSGYCSVPEGETLRFKLDVEDGKQGNYSVFVNGSRISYGDDYWYALEDVHSNLVVTLRDSGSGSGISVPEDDQGGSNSGMTFFQRIAAFFRKIVEFFRGIFNK